MDGPNPGVMCIPRDPRYGVPPKGGTPREPIWLSNIIAPDGHTRDLAHMGVPRLEHVLAGYPQNGGTPDGPEPHSYNTPPDGHTRDLAHMACPGEPQKWVPRPHIWVPRMGRNPIVTSLVQTAIHVILPIWPYRGTPKIGSPGPLKWGTWMSPYG
jgi:hypothetical protein